MTTSRLPAAGSPRGPAAPAAVRLGAERDEGRDRTRQTNRSVVIDALRAMAALMVLVDHVSLIAAGTSPGSIATAISHSLAAGVYLFFVVSGYLIASPFLRALLEGKPLPSLSGYAARRVLRIYPAYWVALATVALVLPPAGGIRPYQVPVHALLLQSSWPHVGEPEAILAPAWTLAIEAMFYLFVPIAAVLLKSIHRGPWQPGRLAVLVAALGVASAGWSYVANVILGSSTSTAALFARIGLQVWLFAFCPGVLIALLVLVRELTGRGLKAQPSISWRRICLAAVVVLWIAAYALWRSGSAVEQTTSTLLYVGACGIVVAVLVTSDIVPKFPLRALGAIGLVSYGIYLWHFIVIDYLWKHADLGLRNTVVGWVLDAVLVLAITMPLAIASWFGIERPCMRYAAEWTRKRRRDGTEATAVSRISRS